MWGVECVMRARGCLCMCVCVTDGGVFRMRSAARLSASKAVVAAPVIRCEGARARVDLFSSSSSSSRAWCTMRVSWLRTDGVCDFLFCFRVQLAQGFRQGCSRRRRQGERLDG